MIKNQLDLLKQQDTYSLILFTLFKIKDIPDYSAISELAYILDKDNLLKLCEYFGGTTIKIPTLDEIENLVFSLLIYQCVDIEHKDIDEVCNSLGERYPDIKEAKKNYKKISMLLSQYKFDLRENL